jgi:hypothetical protein
MVTRFGEDPTAIPLWEPKLRVELAQIPLDQLVAAHVDPSGTAFRAAANSLQLRLRTPSCARPRRVS